MGCFIFAVWSFDICGHVEIEIEILKKEQYYLGVEKSEFGCVLHLYILSRLDLQLITLIY